MIFAGIAVNLLSAYLKNKLDDRLSELSIWWSHRSIKRSRLRSEKIKLLLISDYHFHYEIAKEIRAKNISSIYLVSSLLCLIMGNDATTVKHINMGLLGYLLTAILLLMSSYNYTESINIHLVLEDVVTIKRRALDNNEGQ